MTVSVIAGVETPGDSLDALLAALRKAYADNNPNRAFDIATKLLESLGERNSLETHPPAAAAAYAFRGWAYFTFALDAGKTENTTEYLRLLHEASSSLETSLSVLLHYPDMMLERVMAEGMLAYATYRLGDTERGERLMDLLFNAVNVHGGIQAQTLYLKIRCEIKRFLERATHTSTESTPTEPLQLATTVNVPLGLSPEFRARICAAMEAGEPDSLLEITSGLIAGMPQNVNPDTATMLQQAHVWALLMLARRTSDRARKRALYADALPHLRQLSDEAFKRRDTKTYVTSALDLVYILYSLGQDTEAQQRMAVVTAFVTHSGNPSLRRVWEAAQVRIDGVVIARSFAAM